MSCKTLIAPAMRIFSLFVPGQASPEEPPAEPEGPEVVEKIRIDVGWLVKAKYDEKEVEGLDVALVLFNKVGEEVAQVRERGFRGNLSYIIGSVLGAPEASSLLDLRCYLMVGDFCVEGNIMARGFCLRMFRRFVGHSLTGAGHGQQSKSCVLLPAFGNMCARSAPLSGA